MTFDKKFALVGLPMGLTAVLAGIFKETATLIATFGLFATIAVSMEVTRRARSSLVANGVTART